MYWNSPKGLQKCPRPERTRRAEPGSSYQDTAGNGYAVLERGSRRLEIQQSRLLGGESSKLQIGSRSFGWAWRCLLTAGGQGFRHRHSYAACLLAFFLFLFIWQIFEVDGCSPSKLCPGSNRSVIVLGWEYKTRSNQTAASEVGD